MSTFTPAAWSDIKPGDVVTFTHRAVGAVKSQTRRIRVTEVHEYQDDFAKRTQRASLRGVFLTKAGAAHKVLNSSWTHQGEGHIDTRLSRVVSVERADERSPMGTKGYVRGADEEAAYAEHAERETAAERAHGITVDMIVHEKADPRRYSRVLVVQGDRLKIDTPGNGIGWVNAADVVPHAEECSVDMDALRDEAMTMMRADGHERIRQESFQAARPYVPTASEREAAQLESVTFPEAPVCINTQTHGPHRIAGTFRDHCPGYTEPATLTIDDCTHGDGCRVHPNVNAVHNFDRTPAETRTGISDRAAAALTALAELGKAVSTGGRMPQRDQHMEGLLTLIEQALRNA